MLQVIQEWGKIIATVSGVIATIVAAVRWGYPMVMQWILALKTAKGFKQHFGDDAAKKLSELVATFHTRLTVTEVKSMAKELHTRLGVFTAKADGSWDYVNPALCRLFGRDEESMLGHGWLNAVKDRRDVNESWHYSLTHRIPFEGTFTLANAAGTQVRARAYEVTAPDKTVLCFVGIVVAVEKNPTDHEAI